MATATKTEYSRAKLVRDIDRLGELKAEMSNLQVQYDEIKERLLEAGIEEADGKLFHVKVSEFIVESIDWKGLATSFNPSNAKLKKFSTSRDQVRVLVNARS